MKHDFSVFALSTAVASAALLLLTAGGAWAGSATDYGPAGKHTGKAHGPMGCMHRPHRYQGPVSPPRYWGPRGAMVPPGPRYGPPGAMYAPMPGGPRYGMPAMTMSAPGEKLQPDQGLRNGAALSGAESKATQQSVGAAGDANASVEISGMQFAPAEIRVEVGDTVTWQHRDRAPHTVTGRNGAGPTSQTLQPGASFTHRFEEAGTYEYYCSLHPSMSGTVIVE